MKKKQNKVWFIVLTYQSEYKKLLRHLVFFKNAPHILVDNSETIQSYPKHIPVIRIGKNLGYAGGMNVGIRHCLERGATWVVVTNEDINATSSALNKFIKQLDKTTPGIGGPSTGMLDKKRWTSILGKGTGYISGSFMAIHRQVIDRVGMFYEPYFIYYEDVELCVRAQKIGFELTHIPVSFSHADGTTFGRNSFLHQYYLARNHLLFVERNASVGVKLREAVRLPKTTWEHIRKKEWGALTGIRDYFLRRFGQYKALW